MSEVENGGLVEKPSVGDDDDFTSYVFEVENGGLVEKPSVGDESGITSLA